MVLGNCHQVLFLEPFSFLFILFRFCIVLVIFPSFALKIVLGNCQKELVLEPFSLFFRVFFVLASFPPLPSKLTLEIVKRNFFSNPFRFFFFVLASFPPLPSKVTLEIVRRSFFSSPFRFFPPVPSKLTLEIVKTIFFSNPCRFFSFFFRFKIDFRNCQNEFFLEPLSLFFSFFV